MNVPDANCYGVYDASPSGFHSFPPNDFDDPPLDNDPPLAIMLPQHAHDDLFPIADMLAQVTNAIEDGNLGFCPATYGDPHPRMIGLSGSISITPPEEHEPSDDPRFEPRFPSMRRDPRRIDNEPNTLTMATGRIMKAFQTFGEMTIQQIANTGKCDNKRVYDLVHGLMWLNIITKDESTKSYSYVGVKTDRPFELDELGTLKQWLMEEREKKMKQLVELRRKIRIRKGEEIDEEDSEKE
jgi:hypothetical protein